MVIAAATRNRSSLECLMAPAPLQPTTRTPKMPSQRNKKVTRKDAEGLRKNKKKVMVLNGPMKCTQSRPLRRPLETLVPRSRGVSDGSWCAGNARIDNRNDP